MRLRPVSRAWTPLVDPTKLWGALAGCIELAGVALRCRPKLANKFLLKPLKVTFNLALDSAINDSVTFKLLHSLRSEFSGW